jgi:hypothetical protein
MPRRPHEFESEASGMAVFGRIRTFEQGFSDLLSQDGLKRETVPHPT